MSIEFQQHLDVMYRADSSGDLIRVNDWQGERSAPLFYLGRTESQRFIKFGRDLSQEHRAELESLTSSDIGGMLDYPSNHQRFLEVLNTVTPNLRAWLGPAYCFDYRAEQSCSEIVQLTPEHRYYLNNTMPDWLDDIDHEQPMVGWLEAGQVLGICASVRKNEYAMAAGLEVIESARRRGIGLELTKAWASKVQAMGCIAMYSTSEDNTASQALAAKLNLKLIGSDFHISAAS